MKLFKIEIKLKDGIANPPAFAVHKALKATTDIKVKDVAIEKVMLLSVGNKTTIEDLENACNEFLVNPVTEDFTITEV